MDFHRAAESIRKKNRFYKQLIVNATPAKENKYKQYRNKLNHLIRSAKRDYYDNKFESSKTNMAPY